LGGQILQRRLRTDSLKVRWCGLPDITKKKKKKNKTQKKKKKNSVLEKHQTNRKDKRKKRGRKEKNNHRNQILPMFKFPQGGGPVESSKITKLTRRDQKSSGERGGEN